MKKTTAHGRKLAENAKSAQMQHGARPCTGQPGRARRLQQDSADSKARRAG